LRIADDVRQRTGRRVIEMPDCGFQDISEGDAKDTSAPRRAGAEKLLRRVVRPWAPRPSTSPFG
jgi:hypothetical protein